MTAKVNFLPRAYQLRCRRARRVWRWLVVCAAILAGQGLSAHFLRIMASDVRESRRRLVLMEKNVQEMNAQLARLGAQQRDLARRVQLVDRLGRKHRWSEVLDELVGHLPSTVMLTDLQTDPPKGPAAQTVTGTEARRQGARPGEGQRSGAGVATGLLISGVATDHESIALFMRALNAEEQWGRCQLEATSRKPFMDGEAVNFTIRMRWQ